MNISATARIKFSLKILQATMGRYPMLLDTSAGDLKIDSHMVMAGNIEI